MTLEQLRKERRKDILRVAQKHGARNVRVFGSVACGEILSLARRHGPRNIRVFGSVARGEADERSDIDFLVEMEPGRSLLDMGRLVADLEDLLGQPVDVVTARGIKKRMRERVMKEAICHCEEYRRTPSRYLGSHRQH